MTLIRLTDKQLPCLVVEICDDDMVNGQAPTVPCRGHFVTLILLTAMYLPCHVEDFLLHC